ncbi:hypothetical protein FWK35_00013283 [Aphis craccivora]|uniref:Uncharacterized protein n=1 Tax=Aphis craccivora TaxID=307492 RepID=A0A6G0Z9Q5_APHCR|nr:hypothetical protein FWK35_00013283 [Aphis craccivora]
MDVLITYNLQCYESYNIV